MIDNFPMLLSWTIQGFEYNIHNINNASQARTLDIDTYMSIIFFSKNYGHIAETLNKIYETYIVTK